MFTECQYCGDYRLSDDQAMIDGWEIEEYESDGLWAKCTSCQEKDSTGPAT
jgi:hypothetical protein